MGHHSQYIARQFYEKFANNEKVLKDLAEQLMLGGPNVRKLTWGAIVHDALLFDVGILENLNKFLNAELTNYDISIAMAIIYPFATHGEYQPVVNDEKIVYSSEGIPLPVRIYIPLSGPLHLESDFYNGTVEKGAIFAVYNGAKINFSSIESVPTEFIIIDIPAYYDGKDRLL